MIEGAQKEPEAIFEEHEGSLLVTVKERGLDRSFCKSAAYLLLTQQDQIIYKWTGDMLELGKTVACLFGSTPGLYQIVEGIMIARAAAQEKAERERGHGRG